jgi:hypothetical protein
MESDRLRDMKGNKTIATLRRYVKAYWLDAMTPSVESKGKKEIERINQVLSEKWPTLRARLQVFRPEFEAWLKACIEHVEIRPKFWMDWSFDVYRIDGDKREEIWHSGEIEDFTTFNSTVADCAKIILFQQLTDPTLAGELNTIDLLDNDFPKIIKPQDEVTWYYLAEYDFSLLESYQSISLEDMANHSYCLHPMWRLVKDLLPLDIVELIGLDIGEQARELAISISLANVGSRE